VSRALVANCVGWRRLAVALALVACSAPDAWAQLRVRRNYLALTVAEREKFRDAVKAMKGDATDSGSVGQCSAPASKLGDPCGVPADCDSMPGMGDGACETCEWHNKYDKYVCWHDKCG
jgi:hypothetical protein